MGRLFNSATSTESKPIKGRLFSDPITEKSPTLAKKIGGIAKDVAREVASSAITVPARIPQAIAALSGVSDERINEISKKYSGGLIAPTPQNAGDVVKDVGRVIETGSMFIPGTTAVKLGVGGAVSGLGTSLRQGADLKGTATNIAVGGTLGYGLGKIVGKFLSKPGSEAITPPIQPASILEQTPSKVAENVAQPRLFKPVSESSIANDLHSYVGSGKTIPSKTIDHLKANPIGINELPVNPDGTVTLYREGDITPGKPQSYSITRLPNDLQQVEVRVPKDNILVNFNSNEIDKLYEKGFTKEQIDAGYLEQRRLNRSESEVIATSPEQKVPVSGQDFQKVMEQNSPNFAELPPENQVIERDTWARYNDVLDTFDKTHIDNVVNGIEKPKDGVPYLAYYARKTTEATLSGDINTINKLAQSETARLTKKELGRGLQASQMIEKDNIVNILSDIYDSVKERLPQNILKNESVEVKTISNQLKSLADDLAKVTKGIPTKQEMLDIIEQLKCKV